MESEEETGLQAVYRVYNVGKQAGTMTNIMILDSLCSSGTGGLN